MVAPRTPVLTDTADLSSATAELPPDLGMPDRAIIEPALIADLGARIAVLTELVAHQDAEIARLREPLAENFQIVKQAAFESGVPRATLQYWAEHDKVRHKWRDDRLWIDVVDAIRQRFALAPKPPI